MRPLSLALCCVAALTPLIGCGKHPPQVADAGSRASGGDEVTLNGTFTLRALVEDFSKIHGAALAAEGAGCAPQQEVLVLSTSPVSRGLATHALVAALELGGCALVDGEASGALSGEIVRVADRASVPEALAATGPKVVVHAPSNTLILAQTAPAPAEAASLVALLDARVARTRAVVARDLLDLDALASHGRALPYRGADGEIAGYRLAALPRDGLGHTLGVRNGDVVRAIAGRPVTSKDDATAALQALQDERSFEVEIIRDGQPLSLTYEIR